jgi:hypothetical protein
VLDLAHEDLDAGVKTRGDGLVQDILEPLLLADDAIEEVGPVNVRSLERSKTARLAADDALPTGREALPRTISLSK